MRFIDFRGEEYDPERMRRFAQQVEDALRVTSIPIGSGYVVFGSPDPDRTLDVGTATLADVTRVLANLVNDLLAQNKLRGTE